MGSVPWEVLSTRSNGDRLVGLRGPFAQDLYDAGTPPVHGLAASPAPAPRMANVKIGDRFAVVKEGRRWVVVDDQGVLGYLRWPQTLDGRQHAVTGKVIRIPDPAVLEVQRLLLSPDGTVKDISGTVYPTR